MNNFKHSQTDREQFRNDYSNTFLRDILGGDLYGHNPRNHIGNDCGINHARALQIAFDRVRNHSIWSDLPNHINHVPGA